MHLHNVHIKNIKQANEEDRLAVFVGAGVSKNSDTDYIKLPLWDDLISELKSDLAITKELDYLKLAQLHYLEFGEHTYFQTLKKYFPEDIAPSSLHSTILKINPRVIITTNWDCIIENAIENEGYLYDTICTDKDLVKSTSQNKFIKIHGDFKNHNIVFKEDDYLNYSRNFPLIENYIKSVFSTHTVLFLGYSYNDINLKHIMKWIQSHSSSIPPMYLVNFIADKPQERYLRSHGVTTLILDSENYPIDKIQHLKTRSALTQSFLTSIIDDDRATYANNEQEIISSIYDRIKHLKQQSSISHNQIKRAITNCEFLYDSDGLSILELFKDKEASTTDDSNATKLIHKKFLEVLDRIESLNVDKKKEFYQRNYRLTDIFTILALANVKGIILTNEYDSKQIKYFKNDNIESSQILEQKDREHISFTACECKNHDFIKSLSLESYESYKCGKYELALEKTSELILACKRHRIYSMLLIALFNKNSLILLLKYASPIEKRSQFKKVITEIIELQDEFFKFPRSEIKKNQVLYDFLSLNSVYQEANKCTNKILYLTKTVTNRRNGERILHINEPTCTHINLLTFALKNHIMIDIYAPYKEVMRDFVKISILRQSEKDIVKLNQYELYSAIQFYSSEELESELSVFFKIEGSAQLSLGISDECSEWLVSTVLSNLTDRVIQDQSLLNGHAMKLGNCVLMLSVLNLKDDYISKIMNNISKLIASSLATIGIYEKINKFLAHQHNLFQQNIDTDILKKILNTIIDNVISQNASSWFYHTILDRSINNLYGYIEVEKVKYTDEDRVHHLLSKLKTYELEKQSSFAQSLLYNIFNISNAKIRKRIKTFIKSIISKSKKNKKYNWKFDLWSVAADFKSFDSEAVAKLDKYLEQLRDRKIFANQLDSLKNLIQYLVEYKNIVQLEDANKKLSDLIGQLESRQKD